jgi:hypothetical protein
VCGYHGSVREVWSLGTTLAKLALANLANDPTPEDGAAAMEACCATVDAIEALMREASVVPNAEGCTVWWPCLRALRAVAE